MFRFYRALFSDGPLLKPSSRDRFFHPEEPIMLSGSDRTFFFFFSRAPRAGIDVILATNSTDYPAIKANNELMTALGLRVGGGGEQVATTTANRSATLPDTPAGRAARKFLDATTDEATLRRFIEQDILKRPDDTRTIEQRMASFREGRNRTGALTLVAVVESGATEIAFEARAANGGVLIFRLGIEAQAPFRITGIQAEER
jgi:hypothetical protein